MRFEHFPFYNEEEGSEESSVSVSGEGGGAADDPYKAEIDTIRKEMRQLLREKKFYQEQVQSLPEGATVEELLKFKREHEVKQAESQGDYEAARQQLQEQYNNDTTALKARIQELEALVQELEIVSPATAALATVLHDPQDAFAKGKLKPEMIEQGIDGPVVVKGLERTPIAEWAKANMPTYTLKEPRPTGTGAPIGGGSPVSPSAIAGKVNPWAKGSFNLGEQARILRSNPQEAAAMKKAAGVTY